jgi:hypothetical protein
MGKVQLADAVVTINNDVIGYVPNSVSFTEGLGEQKVLPVSEGGGRVSQVYANDIETSFATFKISIRTTSEDVALALEWKQNANRNVITLNGVDTNGRGVIRTFTQCAVTNDYEVPIQAEGVIELEFMGNAPI